MCSSPQYDGAIKGQIINYNVFMPIHSFHWQVRQGLKCTHTLWMPPIYIQRSKMVISIRLDPHENTYSIYFNAFFVAKSGSFLHFSAPKMTSEG